MDGDDFAAELIVWTEECGSETELICENPQPNSSVASTSFLACAGDTVYILADADAADDPGGTYNLNIAEDTPLAAGDSCCEPHVASLGANTGDSGGDNDTYAIVGCNNLGGADEVWSFTPAEDGIYEVEMDTSSGGAFSAVVMIWNECGSTSDFICGNPDPDAEVATTTFTGFAGQTYYFLADADVQDDLGGAYTLTVTNLGPIPEGEDCNSTASAVDGTNSGGDTSMMANDYDDASCEVAGGGPDPDGFRGEVRR